MEWLLQIEGEGFLKKRLNPISVIIGGRKAL